MRSLVVLAVCLVTASAYDDMVPMASVNMLVFKQHQIECLDNPCLYQLKTGYCEKKGNTDKSIAWECKTNDMPKGFAFRKVFPHCPGSDINYMRKDSCRMQYSLMRVSGGAVNDGVYNANASPTNKSSGGSGFSGIVFVLLIFCCLCCCLSAIVGPSQQVAHQQSAASHHGPGGYPPAPPPGYGAGPPPPMYHGGAYGGYPPPPQQACGGGGRGGIGPVGAGLGGLGAGALLGYAAGGGFSSNDHHGGHYGGGGGGGYYGGGGGGGGVGIDMNDVGQASGVGEMTFE